MATELGKTKTMKLSGRIQSKVFAVRGLIRYVIHRQRGGGGGECPQLTSSCEIDSYETVTLSQTLWRVVT